MLVRAYWLRIRASSPHEFLKSILQQASLIYGVETFCLLEFRCQAESPAREHEAGKQTERTIQSIGAGAALPTDVRGTGQEGTAVAHGSSKWRPCVKVEFWSGHCRAVRLTGFAHLSLPYFQPPPAVQRVLHRAPSPSPQFRPPLPCAVHIASIHRRYHAYHLLTVLIPFHLVQSWGGQAFQRQDHLSGGEGRGIRRGSCVQEMVKGGIGGDWSRRWRSGQIWMKER